MALLETLIDNFNDDVIGPEWGNSYGGVSEVGGRARVPCVAASWAGYQTAKVWTLAGSSVFLQVPTVPAVSTATEASIVFSIIIATDGTSLAFNIDSAAGTLRCESNTDYFDGAATVLTYSSVDHLWLRLSEDGTNVYWDTSPNGSTWTNRRTLATPAWVTSAVDGCALDLFCYRDAGTTDYGEFDNVNTLSDAAVHNAAATLTADGDLTAGSSRSTHGAAALTATSTVTASPTLTAHASATLTAEAQLAAGSQGPDSSDVHVGVAQPRGRWKVGGPWI